MTTDSKPVLVVVEDLNEALDELEKLSKDAGFETVSCQKVDEAIRTIDRYLGSQQLVGVLSDLKLADPDGGWKILRHAYEKSKALRLALYTAYAADPVPRLLTSGAAYPAFEIFEKHRDRDKLRHWLQRTRELWDARIGLTLKDADTKQIYETLVPIYSRSNLPILILGETGTGKDSLAKRIHDTSPRRNGPWVPVNCGGLEPSLAFSELFGHTANAFTDAGYHELGLVLRASGYKPGPPREGNKELSFEDWLRKENSDLEPDVDGFFNSKDAAERSGSLFLDEITTLPRKVMAGLLRLLSTFDVAPLGHHDRRVRAHCRIIAATNETSILESSLVSKRDEVSGFRRDLCYRLGGAILTLPALRDRDPEDIKNYVRNTVWSQLAPTPMPVQDSAVEYIVALYKGRTDDTARQYQLGNFRTLRNLVYRSALIALEERGGEITREHVELAVRHGRLQAAESESLNEEKHIREVFRRALEKRGLKMDGNFSWDELKRLTAIQPVAVAYGFLACCLQIKLAPNRGYYKSSEVQRALASGLTLSAWLGKGLKREHILAAIAEYFTIDTSDWAPDLPVSAIVQKLREDPNERHQ